jgi:hypothetical protein
MLMKVLCGHCQSSFAFTVPEPLEDAPPPLDSDRTQLSLTCTHCSRAVSLRLRTADVAQAAAIASGF